MADRMIQSNQVKYSAQLKLCVSSERSENPAILNHPLSTVEDILLGREATCHIAINSVLYPTVSRQHAKIQPVQNGTRIQWQVCDLNAANGTYVNGERLQNCRLLQTGDRITLSKEGPAFLFECQEIVVEFPNEPITISSNESVLEEPIAEMHVLEDLPTNPAIDEQTLQPVTQQAAISNEDSQQLDAPAAPVTIKIADRPINQSPFSLWGLSREGVNISLSGHTDNVRSVSFSSDGKFLASGSVDKTIKLWDLATNSEICSLSGHKMVINSIAFNPEDQVLASGSADKTIRLWDLVSQSEIQTLGEHKMAVTAVSFSASGEYLASGSADKTIKLWNVRAGEAVQLLAGHKMAVTALALSLDGELLVSGGSDRTVKLWNPISGEEIATLPPFRAAITALALSPDHCILIVGCDDKTARAWNLQTQQEICIFPGHPQQTSGIAVSTDGRSFACGIEKNIIQVWSL